MKTLKKIEYEIGTAKKTSVDELGGELEFLIGNKRHAWWEVGPAIGIGRDASPMDAAYGLKVAKEAYKRILSDYGHD